MTAGAGPFPHWLSVNLEPKQPKQPKDKLKMKKLITSSAAILASVALLHTAATAQVAPPSQPPEGDLILGFQTASPNTGSSDNLEVDLGSDSLFTTSATLNLSSELAVSDITGDYGSNAPALYLGVVGTLGSGAGDDITFISTPVGATEPKTAPSGTTGKTQLSTISNPIGTLYTGYTSATPGAG